MEQFIRKSLFKENIADSIIFQTAPWELFLDLMEAELRQLPCRVIFCGFWALTSTWALVNRRKLHNPRKIILHGNCHNSASKKGTKVPKVPFER